MPRPGYFTLTLPDRIEDKLDKLVSASGRSRAWVVELLTAVADTEAVTDPAAMMIVYDRRRRRRPKGSPPNLPQEG